MSTPAILAAEGIGLTLGGARVLGGVSHRFAPGRVSALLGPNGAGKSSLLACLAALRTPDAGGATLGGENVAALGRRERGRRIGLLPQGGEVHWNVDVRTLAGLGRLPHRGRWGETDADRAAVAAAMAATDVARFAHRGVGELSGGERGRALLARVLAGEPDWLLADEPLAGLDPGHQLDVLDRLRAVAAGGRGVVVVMHDLHLAARAADEVVLLDRGKVAAAGPATEVLAAPALERVYGVRAEVGATPAGTRYVLPVGRVEA